MPDTAALDMPAPRAISADILPTKEGPALSATSDMPAAPKGEIPVRADEPEKPAEAKAESAAELSKADAKPEPSKDETPPEVKRAISRAKNETKAEAAARQAAETRADRAEKALQRALELAEKVTGQPAKEAAVDAKAVDPRPRRETFDNPEAYDAALDSWMGRAAERAAEAAIDRQKKADEKTAADKKKADDEAAAAEEVTSRAISFQERVGKFKEQAPDFDAVVMRDPEEGGPKIAHNMSVAIMEADNGPAIAYYLGKNQSEAERISGLSPARQVFEIGRISTRLENESAAKVAKEAEAKISKVPEPIKPVSSANGHAVAKAPEDETMDEYAARRNAALAAERKARVSGVRVN